MAEREQPRAPQAPRTKPGQPLIQQAVNNWTLADASAIQALTRGEATPDQQKRALDWILRKACALPEWAYQPGTSDRDTNIALGRQFVGHQIVKLQNADMSRLRRSEPNADQAEPKS